MEYDIKLIDQWEAPKENDARLLTMPNIPLPLHSLAPRTIMGQKKWDILRKREYMKQKYTCQISKKELGHGHCHLHEVYDIDWRKQISTFKRYIVLSPKIHTRFIHSGRALTLFQNGDKQMPKEFMLKTLEKGFKIIADYNMKHYNDEPLRVCDTILEWAKNPELKSEVNKLIERYKIKFYTFNKDCFNKENWGKWKLIYDGKEYPTKFPTKEDWEEYFRSRDER